jgi:hypothetical protein
MTIIEMAAELAKPNLRALGASLTVLPGGLGWPYDLSGRCAFWLMVGYP